MPPRLNKRQQRELEEQSALQSIQAELSVDADQDDANSIVKTTTHFAALSTGVESDVEQSDDDAQVTSKKSKKKRKKPVAAAPVAVTKKADKKAKARQKKAEQDSFDAALAEMSQKYPELSSTSNTSHAKSSASSDTLAALLSVSLTHLNPEAELRKFFGAKVLKAQRAESSATASSRQRRTQGPNTHVRSHLTTPPKEWAAARQPREGLTARALSEDEVGERRNRHGWDSNNKDSRETWWTVECNRRYKRLTKRFMQIVASGDPNAFVNLLFGFPWHVDTLLQQAEIARHREEHSTASELLSRALFSFELPLQLSAFSFTSGLHRLDFDYVENRPFYLAVHRHILDLTRRGLFRTSFEFARLLYSLDPCEDPHGALFWLDWLAVRCGMGDWLLDVFAIPSQNGRVNPTVLPGWLYARALAAKQKGVAGSDEMLKEAIVNYPQVVVLLADKADIDIDAQIRSRPEFRIHTDASGLNETEATVHLLAHLYVHRAHGLWKEPSIASWFSSTLSSVSADSLQSRPRFEKLTQMYKNQNVLYSVYRHIITVHSSIPLPAHRSFLSFIPASVPSSSLACDPIPPLTAVSSYTPSYFADVSSSHEDDEGGMMGDPNIRAQLERLLALRPDLLEMLQGMNLNGEDEAQMEVLNDVLMQAGELGPEIEEERAQMPGGFDGAQAADDNNENEDGSEDSSDEENASAAAMPVRLVRNLIGRLWGVPAVERESSDEDEEEEERQRLNEDVD